MKKLLNILFMFLILSCSSVESEPIKPVKKINTEVVTKNISNIKKNEKNLNVIISSLEEINKEQDNIKILQVMAELKLVNNDRKSADKDFEKLTKLYKDDREFLVKVYAPLALYIEEKDKAKYTREHMENIYNFLGRIYEALNYIEDAKINYKKNILYKEFNNHLLDDLYDLAFKTNNEYEKISLKNTYLKHRGDYKDEQKNNIPLVKSDSILKMDYMPYYDIPKLYTNEEFDNMVLKLIFEESNEQKMRTKIQVLETLYRYLGLRLDKIEIYGNDIDISVIGSINLKHKGIDYIKSSCKKVIERLNKRNNMNVNIFRK
ncbi:hypothetical protein [Oceanivirga salmonicida]|uniref:hypothetical protein n=1 Tax=Oceanivirga salmonicida TaxID=1769291 RepID=UPI0008316492|nr:hypothetical protein [Oceanivirga salmonicida]